MDTTRTDAIASTWLISLGHSTPPPDIRRLASVETPEIKKTRKPRQADKSKMLIKSRDGKKLRRGIFALLRAGIDDHVQIYDLLFYYGFIKKHVPGKSGNGISANEFRKYLYQSMVHLKIPKKTKGYRIIDAFKSGKKIVEITKEVKARRSYVRRVLIEAGLIEKLPRKVAKPTPPAWSKRGIK